MDSGVLWTILHLVRCSPYARLELECLDQIIVTKLRTEIAAKREAQGPTDPMYSQGTQLGDTLAQSVLGNGDRVVEVDCAGCLHAVLLVQEHLRWHAADCRGDGSDNDGRQVCDCAIASKHHARPFLASASKLVQADVSAGYSAGHAASASHGCDSLLDCAALE